MLVENLDVLVHGKEAIIVLVCITKCCNKMSSEFQDVGFFLLHVKLKEDNKYRKKAFLELMNQKEY